MGLHNLVFIVVGCRQGSLRCIHCPIQTCATPSRLLPAPSSILAPPQYPRLQPAQPTRIAIYTSDCVGKGHPQGLTLAIWTADPGQRQTLHLSPPAHATQPGRVAELDVVLTLDLSDITGGELGVTRVSPAGATWHCEFLALSAGARVLYLAADAELGRGCQSATAPLAATWRNPRADCELYCVSVRTPSGGGPPPGASLCLRGARGSSGWRELAPGAAEAAWQLRPLGALERVELRCDRGAGPWLLDSVLVEGAGPGARLAFLALHQAWVAGGDRLDLPFMPAGQAAEVEVTLHCQALCLGPSARPYLVVLGHGGSGPPVRVYLPAGPRTELRRAVLTHTLTLPRAVKIQALAVGVQGLGAAGYLALDWAVVESVGEAAAPQVCRSGLAFHFCWGRDGGVLHNVQWSVLKLPGQRWLDMREGVRAAHGVLPARGAGLAEVSQAELERNCPLISTLCRPGTLRAARCWKAGGRAAPPPRSP